MINCYSVIQVTICDYVTQEWEKKSNSPFYGGGDESQNVLLRFVERKKDLEASAQLITSFIG